ncbi:hypothetical protein PSCICN_00660 [Pseudomonas cichorii]|nr:hypothetical protein PSCICN_00660 [Pseudomonas cichorii]
MPPGEYLPRRAPILVRLNKIDEILFAESAFGFAARCEGVRYEASDAGLLARKDFQTFVIASVGNHR